MEGILDLERLLSRVALETANPRDMLPWGSFSSFRWFVPHWHAFLPRGCKDCTPSATN